MMCLFIGRFGQWERVRSFFKCSFRSIWSLEKEERKKPLDIKCKEFVPRKAELSATRHWIFLLPFHCPCANCRTVWPELHMTLFVTACGNVLFTLWLNPPLFGRRCCQENTIWKRPLLGHVGLLLLLLCWELDGSISTSSGLHLQVHCSGHASPLQHPLQLQEAGSRDDCSGMVPLLRHLLPTAVWTQQHW